MKKYQIFVSDTSRLGVMKRFSFSILHARLFVGFLILLALVAGVVLFDYSMAVSRQIELEKLRTENQELNQQISTLHEKFQGLSATVEKVEDFSFKLKTILNHSPNRPSHLAIGPLPQMYHQGLDEKPQPASEDKKLEFQKVQQMKSQSLEEDLFLLESKSRRLLKGVWELIGQLEEHKYLLSATPSIMPVADGWITSRFGYRNYPFFENHLASSQVTDFHRGLDIASRVGTHVMAPADGVVVAAGYDLSTGNYIIVNHGYEMKTLYGHLDSIKVRRQQKVQRGDIIATIGNTGRSTGPHLHYEVRISGQPVDPEYYILNTL